jgi:hypothetical protein
MCEIIIDEQFKSLLPALDKQTYAQLEESLLENGCMHPLVLWDKILVDGHNRYEICQKHGIEFKTANKEFASRDEALIWIISTQVGRRNLTPMQLSYFRGLHYKTDKKMVTNETGRNQHSGEKEVGPQNEAQPPQGQKTAGRIADQYNVSRATINRDAQVAEALDAIGEVSAAAKSEILSGAASITRQHLQELAASGSKDEIRIIAESIEEGTYEKPKKSADTSPPEGVFLGIIGALNEAIAKMAEAYNAEMRLAESEGDATRLRSALRGHIDMLEDLYRSL